MLHISQFYIISIKKSINKVLSHFLPEESRRQNKNMNFL